MAEEIYLVLGCGGCAALVRNATLLALEDSDRLPMENIAVGWINFDGTEYEIGQEFLNISDLLSYLNTTFVISYGLDGIFTQAGDIIEYSNPENFTTAEIMAIYQNYVYPYRNGNPETINIPYKDTFANLNVITDPDLVGKEVQSLMINRTNSEPITETGYIFDSINGTITFPVDNPPVDSNIYVFLKQTAS